MDMKGRGRAGGMRTMSMDNILGDPFALATISIAMVCRIHNLLSWLCRIADDNINQC
jgi:SHO1 osmosensor